MDRQIVYPGAIPLDTDVLNIQRNVMVALGYLAQATLGSAVVVDGLACVPTQPASMSVVVGPGSITQLGVVDANAFGSLPADSSDPLMKLGVNLQPTRFTLTAPAVPGQATNYLIEAAFVEADGTPVVLPYYNAANPAQPYSGPGNGGGAQNTQRTTRVQLQVKAGAPAVAGQQSTPAVDAGWVGLYAVTVGYGQSSIGATSIAALPNAPFVGWKLPNLTPGYRNMAMFTPANQGVWTVPAGITVVKLRVWGGGGGGGPGVGTAGGGGAGGGYSEGYYPVSPGQAIQVTVGAGGAGPSTPGGTSSFGSLASATGGQSGASGGTGTVGVGAAIAGSGYGSGIVSAGSAGGAALTIGSSYVSGSGGAAHGSAGGVAAMGGGSAAVAGIAGVAPGGGGSGGVGNAGGGGGAAGLVVVEW